MSTPLDTTIRQYLVLGWTLLALAAFFGLGLEAMHGLKLGFYLDLDVQVRRHMWTLCHAHATMLGLLQLGLAMTIQCMPAIAFHRATIWGGRLLLAAALLMPSGFFLGGLWFYAGDPGLGVLLVPIGGAALVAALLLIAFACRGHKISTETDDAGASR